MRAVSHNPVSCLLRNGERLPIHVVDVLPAGACLKLANWLLARRNTRIAHCLTPRSIRRDENWVVNMGSTWSKTPPCRLCGKEGV